MTFRYLICILICFLKATNAVLLEREILLRSAHGCLVHILHFSHSEDDFSLFHKDGQGGVVVNKAGIRRNSLKPPQIQWALDLPLKLEEYFKFVKLRQSLACYVMLIDFE